MLGIFCLEIHQAAAARNSSEMTVDAIRMTRPRREGVTAASTSWGGCSNSSGRCSKAGSVLGADVCKRLLHRRGFGDLLVRLLRLLVGLVVDGLGVDRPDVVVGAVADVLDGPDRGQRGVVGVVVAVKPVAADLVQVADAGEPVLDDVDALVVVLV